MSSHFRSEAVELDGNDNLNLRDQFIIPTKVEAWNTSLPTQGTLSVAPYHLSHSN